MDKRIKNILGLREYQVLEERFIEQDEEIVVALPPFSRCPHCSAITSRVHQQLKRPRRVLWGFINGHKLWLLLHRRRLKCLGCGKVFSQPLPGVAPRQRVSAAAQSAILGALAEQSFAALGRSYSISYSRAQRLILRLPVPWCGWEFMVGEGGPIALGIDEHSPSAGSGQALGAKTWSSP